MYRSMDNETVIAIYLFLDIYLYVTSIYLYLPITYLLLVIYR